MNKLRVGVLAVFALLAACTASPPPKETTADGLERVPSRAEGGVYRDLDADFTRYKRLMIEPMTVEFREGWRKQHPDVADTELRRIQLEAAKDFREVFTKIMVDEGPFELAEVREADVFVVVPRLLDLDIPAPETDLDAGNETSSPRPVALQMTGELRDGVSGEILLRVIRIEAEPYYMFDGIRRANRVTNAHEIRVSMEKWSRLVREAIDVAKATKPPDPRQNRYRWPLPANTGCRSRCCARAWHRWRRRPSCPTDLEAKVGANYQPVDRTSVTSGRAWSGSKQAIRTSPQRLIAPELDAYTRGVVERLIGRPAPDLRIYVMRDASLNAAMLPSGMMIVNTGLLARIRNEAQFAAVLGHEAGHYFRKHSLDMHRDTRRKSAMATAAASAARADSYSSSPGTDVVEHDQPRHLMSGSRVQPGSGIRG